MTLRAITVKPPWSWAISQGPKRVENRVWRRSYRGPLAIHAGKGWDWDGDESPLVQEAWRNAGHDVYRLGPSHQAMTLGAVVAVVQLVDICDRSTFDLGPLRCDCGPWAARGQYHWRLADVRPLAEPVPCKGALGLWTIPDEVEAMVRAQLLEVPLMAEQTTFD